MNKVDILAKQTEDAYSWVNKLIDTIPHDRWNITPAIIETNVSWQIGHLVVSFYYHTIMVISGHQADVLRSVPMKEYDTLFTKASPRDAIDKVNPITLQEHLLFMQQRSLVTIRSLSEEHLDNQLEPTPFKHPIAHTKWDALNWNIKHTMWHCGQIGMLRRVVDKRFDFGLQKAE